MRTVSALTSRQLSARLECVRIHFSFGRGWSVTYLIFGISYGYAEWNMTTGNWRPSRAFSAMRARLYFRVFKSAVDRNHDRFCLRWLRARASPLSETSGTITPENGNVQQIPPGDVMAPAEQRGTLPFSPPFELANSEFEPQRADGNDVRRPNEQTLKRSGVDLDAPSPQRACATFEEAKEFGALEVRELGGSELRAQRGLEGRNRVEAIEIATGNFNHAARSPY